MDDVLDVPARAKEAETVALGIIAIFTMSSVVVQLAALKSKRAA